MIPAVRDTTWQLLSGLHPADHERVVSSAGRRQFLRGETIYHEADPGDSCHLLAAGHVAVRLSTPLGDVATLAILGPGSAFGEQALVGSSPLRGASVVALDEVTTLSIRRADFDQLRRQYPTVERALVAMLAAAIERLNVQLLDALYLPVDRRVLRRLVDAAALFSTDPASAVVVPLTQADVASMAGTTRPSANRVLRMAAERGLILVKRGRLVILDPPRLIEAAYGAGH